MALTYTHTQAVLAETAAALSGDATEVGLTALSGSLTSMATEINQAATELEFYGGKPEGVDGKGSAAVAWAQTLYSAGKAIQTKSIKVSADNQILIESHLNVLQSVVETVSELDSEYGNNDSGSTFTPGPHIRNVSTSWRLESSDYSNEEIGRALMLINMLETNTIERVREELETPTAL